MSTQWYNHLCMPLSGPLDHDVFKDIPSLQLHAPFNEKARRLCEKAVEAPEHHKTVVSRAKIVRRSLIVLVGVPIGIVSVVLKRSIHYIWKFRVGFVLHSLRDAADGDDWFILAALAVGALLTVTSSLVAASCVAWKPAAASSGIPRVIAFLNGCDLQSSLGCKVLLAKIVGTAFAVGSGLAVGPEGPMIYIGACFGTVVVRKVLRPLLRRVNGEVEDELTHDSLTYNVQAAAMGAGAGIAAAFHAPLAGTIFVVEEAASFFSKELFLHTFLTCMASVFTVQLLEWSLGLEPDQYYSGSPICISNIQLSSLLVLQVVTVSVACAVLAIVFNRVVVYLNIRRALATKELGQGRKLLCNQFKRVLAIALCCGSLPVLLIALRPCQDCSLQTVFEMSNGCIPNEWLPQIFRGSKSKHQEDVGANIHSNDHNPYVFAFEPMPFLFGAQYAPITCPAAILRQPRCRIRGIGKHLVGSPWNETHYCCAYTNMSELKRGRFANYSSPLAPLAMSEEQWPRAACPHGRQDANTGVSVEQYSPLAALFLAQPDDVVRSILVRGAPNILPTPDLAAFLVLYTGLVVVSTTAWVPGGLLVPMMIIGSAAGRLCGLLWEWAQRVEARNFRTSIVWTPEYKPLLDLIHPGVFKDPKPGLPVEPGVLALAGCAAFLSGSGSIVFFVLVLLIEITLEPYLTMIIIIAVIVSRSIVVLARCTGVSEGGLYHELINVQSLPYLHEHTHWRQGYHNVEDLLKEDLRIRREADADSMAETGSHAGAPGHVRDDFESSQLLVKVVRRRTSIAEVKRVLGYCLPGDDHPMINGFPVVEEGGQLSGLVTRKELERLVAEAEGSQHDGAVSLDSVSVDNAPFVIQGHKPVLHAHALISGCGARHVVVVDGANKPIGVITRKTLMPWRTPLRDTVSQHDSFAEVREVYRSSISGTRIGLSERLRSQSCHEPGTPVPAR